jgi:hypothetical protein
MVGVLRGRALPEVGQALLDAEDRGPGHILLEDAREGGLEDVGAVQAVAQRGLSANGRAHTQKKRAETYGSDNTD